MEVMMQKYEIDSIEIEEEDLSKDYDDGTCYFCDAHYHDMENCPEIICGICGGNHFTNKCWNYNLEEDSWIYNKYDFYF